VRTERQRASRRRYRARAHNGHAIIRIEIERDPVLLALLSTGRLTDEEALDPHRVETALSEVISTWAKLWANSVRSN
jgi:hypothetical protein